MAKGVGPVGAKRILTVPEEKYEEVVQATYSSIYGVGWEQVYSEMMNLVRLQRPTDKCTNKGDTCSKDVGFYGSKIQKVEVEETNVVQAILNSINGPDESVLRNDQRPHEGDILCPPSDFSI